jgi:hypothetical protein
MSVSSVEQPPANRAVAMAATMVRRKIIGWRPDIMVIAANYRQRGNGPLTGLNFDD